MPIRRVVPRVVHLIRGHPAHCMIVVVSMLVIALLAKLGSLSGGTSLVQGAAKNEVANVQGRTAVLSLWAVTGGNWRMGSLLNDMRS